MSLKSEKTSATMLRQYGEIFYKILYFREMSVFWFLLKAFALAKATMIKISQKMRMRFIKMNGEFLGTSTLYYYFYNIKYGNPCRAPRTQVSGTVNPPPTLTLSSNTFTICQGESDVITITEGAENYDSYTWSPSAGVTGSATTGWTFNPTVHTNYTLTAHNSEDDCTKITTVNVTVSTAPIYTNLEGQYEVCPNNSVDRNNFSCVVRVLQELQYR